jgi:hypothetical protein
LVTCPTVLKITWNLARAREAYHLKNKKIWAGTVSLNIGTIGGYQNNLYFAHHYISTVPFFSISVPWKVIQSRGWKIDIENYGVHLADGSNSFQMAICPLWREIIECCKSTCSCGVIPCR